MRFALLGSGSRGNATLVQSGGTCVMVDCGFSVAETTMRLTRLEVEPDQIDAILVTHEHADHVNGVVRFACRYDIPVHCTAGTLAACSRLGLEQAEIFDPHSSFCVDAIEIIPIIVPHDAREPTQFAFSDGDRRLGLLTDTGHATSHILQQLAGCAALILECNHDRERLENGLYPAMLKQRVAGPLGHLSNAQAAELLSKLDYSDLQHVVAAHLSEKNNTPELARAALAEALDCEQDWIQVASQEQGLGWRELH